MERPGAPQPGGRPRRDSVSSEDSTDDLVVNRPSPRGRAQAGEGRPRAVGAGVGEPDGGRPLGGREIGAGAEVPERDGGVGPAQRPLQVELRCIIAVLLGTPDDQEAYTASMDALLKRARLHDLTGTQADIAGGIEGLIRGQRGLRANLQQLATLIAETDLEDLINDPDRSRALLNIAQRFADAVTRRVTDPAAEFLALTEQLREFFPNNEQILSAMDQAEARLQDIARAFDTDRIQDLERRRAENDPYTVDPFTKANGEPYSVADIRALDASKARKILLHKVLRTAAMVMGLFAAVAIVVGTVLAGLMVTEGVLIIGVFLGLAALAASFGSIYAQYRADESSEIIHADNALRLFGELNPMLPQLHEALEEITRSHLGSDERRRQAMAALDDAQRARIDEILTQTRAISEALGIYRQE